MAEKKTLLAVGAHPDDMDFGASGTVVKHVEAGWDAYYLICADGSRGSSDPNMTHERLAKIRRDEQLAAAKILGLKDVFFLDHLDTQLTADLILKEEIVHIIRTVRPQLVITMDPTFFYTTESVVGNTAFINHTDHRAAALATMDAVFPLSRDRLTFPAHEKDGLSPHRVSDLWFTSFHKKAEVEDISSTFDKKIKALAAHVSQFDNFEQEKKRVTDRAIHHATDEEFTYAESFIKLRMP